MGSLISLSVFFLLQQNLLWKKILMLVLEMSALEQESKSLPTPCFYSSLFFIWTSIFILCTHTVRNYTEPHWTPPLSPGLVRLHFLWDGMTVPGFVYSIYQYLSALRHTNSVSTCRCLWLNLYILFDWLMCRGLVSNLSFLGLQVLGL